MKITREKLKQIIKEELESFTEIEKPLAVTPDAKMTGSQQTRKMRADASTATSDCLLYTSPSPRDRQKSRMPSSA